jgi:hypothetical protein
MIYYLKLNGFVQTNTAAVSHEIRQQTYSHLAVGRQQEGSFVGY